MNFGMYDFMHIRFHLLDMILSNVSQARYWSIGLWNKTARYKNWITIISLMIEKADPKDDCYRSYSKSAFITGLFVASASAGPAIEPRR